MTSMIFGATSSHCTALYVRDRNAREFDTQFPRAVEAIVRKHYMDDYLDSTDTGDEAIKIIREVAEVHSRGGFEIRDWTSNSQRVLSSLPAEKLTTGSIDLALGQIPIEKTLGLIWNPNSDTFSFSVGLAKEPGAIRNGDQAPTKREMLRVFMSVFDPLGFLQPFTIRSKILLQSVWRSGITWDEQLVDEEFTRWKGWINELKIIAEFLTPHCYVKRTDHRIVELHLFCDASEEAYTAVAYWRFLYEDNSNKVAFISEKSRVTPLKTPTIPRLELQAALLASRFAKNIETEHDFHVNKHFFWTDSRVVLSWIHSDTCAHRAFESHRLREIDDITEVSEWNWVPTAQNPADVATRGKGPFEEHLKKWTQGADFLIRNNSEWPTSQI